MDSTKDGAVVALKGLLLLVTKVEHIFMEIHAESQYVFFLATEFQKILPTIQKLRERSEE